MHHIQEPINNNILNPTERKLVAPTYVNQHVLIASHCTLTTTYTPWWSGESPKRYRTNTVQYIKVNIKHDLTKKIHWRCRFQRSNIVSPMKTRPTTIRIAVSKAWSPMEIDWYPPQTNMNLPQKKHPFPPLQQTQPRRHLSKDTKLLLFFPTRRAAGPLCFERDGRIWLGDLKLWLNVFLSIYKKM